MFLKSLISKILITGCFLLSLCQVANAQMDTEPYSFQLPDKKVNSSLYNKISVVDARNDTSNMGIIQTGAFNKQNLLVAKEPLRTQFNNILNALVDSSQKQGQLIIQLRRLRFNEVTSAVSEKGYFTFKAELYAFNNGSYKKISSIDTLSTVGAMDVTNKNLKKGSEIIAEFISSNLKKEPVETIYYSYNDILKVDSIEKKTFKLYTTDAYTDGVYLTYNAFRDQTPSAKLMVDGDEPLKNNTKMQDSAGVWRKIKLTSVYALVYKGKPYIATQYGYYPLTKSNNDFIFTGKGNVSTNTSVMMGYAIFGALGGAIAASEKSTFEMKIDQESGQLIRLKEIKENTDPGY